MSEIISCRTGLTGRIRGMKGEDSLPPQAGQGPCWEETLDAGPYDCRASRESDARFRHAERATVKLSLRVVGDPMLHAKCIVEVRGISVSVALPICIEIPDPFAITFAGGVTIRRIDRCARPAKEPRNKRPRKLTSEHRPPSGAAKTV